MCVFLKRSFNFPDAKISGLDGPSPFPNQSGCFPVDVSKIIFITYIMLIVCETCESRASRGTLGCWSNFIYKASWLWPWWRVHNTVCHHSPPLHYHSLSLHSTPNTLRMDYKDVSRRWVARNCYAQIYLKCYSSGLLFYFYTLSMCPRCSEHVFLSKSAVLVTSVINIIIPFTAPVSCIILHISVKLIVLEAWLWKSFWNVRSSFSC